MRREPHDLLDRSLTVLTRHAAHALCRLAEIDVAPDQIRFEDTAVNVAEHRADQVLLLGEEGDPARWGWHLEYQIEPDTSVMEGWLLKNAALNSRLPVPVILTVVYLTRGDRTTFPNTYRREGGPFSNDFRFPTLLLWEYADEIRGGKYPELAPLLVLCEDKPTEQTLRREREIILDLPRAVRAEMLAIAMAVGVRCFARHLLEAVFQKEIGMLKEVEFIRDLFADEFAEVEARGEARGRAEGEARGRAEGEALAARQLVLRQLQMRFGELPDSVVQRVMNADRDWCMGIGERLLEARSLTELDLRESDPGDV